MVGRAKGHLLMSNLLDRLKGRNTGVSNKTVGQAYKAGVNDLTPDTVTGRDGNLRGEAQQNLRGLHGAAPVMPKLADLGVTKTQSDFARSIAAVEFGEARHRHRWGGR
jgi:hypothetical protein